VTGAGEDPPAVPGEWLLTFGQGASVLERAHAKGDAAIRGPAGDLLLVLWGRRPPSSVDVVGDGAVLDQLLAQVRF